MKTRKDFPIDTGDALDCGPRTDQKRIIPGLYNEQRGVSPRTGVQGQQGQGCGVYDGQGGEWQTWGWRGECWLGYTMSLGVCVGGGGGYRMGMG